MKTTVVLSRDNRGLGKEGYYVEQTTNRREPEIGACLSPSQVDDLLAEATRGDRDLTVTIRAAKDR